MSATRGLDLGGRLERSIHIGGVYASSSPTVISTILGSCISVCLRDPVTGAGGMNHCMLPEGTDNGSASTRYGVHAMELLINECMRAGADRRRLEAKVFGGGHVLMIQESEDNVPRRNIRFALKFLAAENIPIVSQDTGGKVTRKLCFFSDTGRALLQKMHRGTDTEIAALERLRAAEQQALRPVAPSAAAASDDNVTLF